MVQKGENNANPFLRWMISKGSEGEMGQDRTLASGPFWHPPLHLYVAGQCCCCFLLLLMMVVVCRQFKNSRKITVPPIKEKEAE